MGLLYLIAAVVIPFSAEAMATRLPAPESGPIRKGPGFYLLTPLMGAVVYTSFCVIAAHPYLALAGSALFYFGLTAISNKKYEVLRDPFNAHDFDNARNLYIYPEFYLSYVGWKLLALVALIFGGLIGASIWYEDPFRIYSLFDETSGPIGVIWDWGKWFIILGGWLVVLDLARELFVKLFHEHSVHRFGLTFDLKHDVQRFGLFPTMMLYRMLLKASPNAGIVAEKAALRASGGKAVTAPEQKPDIIAVQGESYFDLARLFERIEPGHTWETLDALRAAGVSTGKLNVPAWGAYTMQTEFSFLSGIENSKLGIDRINPYMRFAQQKVTTIASRLREAGYRTLCVHPAKKEFFRRADVMPNLGFDAFVGLEGFGDAEYYGKYIADSELAEKIEAIIRAYRAEGNQPLFIFAITIESHGPWAPGRLAAVLPEGVTEDSLTASNLTGDPEFSLYQQHMENLMAMYKRLSVDADLKGSKRVVGLYGDHMPALWDLFSTHGFTDAPVDYLLWNSEKQAAPESEQSIETFADTILKEAGIQ